MPPNFCFNRVLFSSITSRAILGPWKCCSLRVWTPLYTTMRGRYIATIPHPPATFTSTMADPFACSQYNYDCDCQLQSAVDMAVEDNRGSPQALALVSALERGVEAATRARASARAHELLLEAAHKGDVETLASILRNERVSVDRLVANEAGWTPLIFAATTGNLATATLLVIHS